MQVTAFLRQRAEASEYDYPLLVPAVAHVVGLALAIIAVVQRDAFVPPGWPLLFGMIAGLTPMAFDLIKPGVLVPRPLLVVIITTATALLLLQQPDTQFDFAPLILGVMTAEVAATSRLLVSVTTALCALGTLAAFWLADLLDGAVYDMAGVVLGWTIGHLLLTQLKLLHHERESLASRSEQAATHERQRIAREVHDVVAHSLSVTLLHLTGARRALEQDRDIEEAIDSLTDAEHLGRQAMSDIRRTVGLLDAGPKSTRPEPGGADIPDLIDGFRRAGLPVTFQVKGDVDSVTGATGLSIYRLTQESLANVVKHAGTSADVRLEISATTILLEVHNPTARVRAVTNNEVGSGIRGMRERTTLLGGDFTAGPTSTGWCVRVHIPLEGDRCIGTELRRITRLM